MFLAARKYRDRAGRLLIRVAVILLILAAIAGLVVLLLTNRQRPGEADALAATPTSADAARSAAAPAAAGDYIAEPDPSPTPEPAGPAREAPEQRVRYAMDITLEPAGNRLVCVQQVELTNRSEEALNSLSFLSFPGMLGTEALQDGPLDQSAAKFPIRGVKTSFVLERALVNGEDADAEVSEDGGTIAIPLTFEWLPGDGLEATLCYTVSLPYSAFDYGYNARGYNAAWFYPVAVSADGEPQTATSLSLVGSPFALEAADYIVTVHVPSDYALSATGRVVGMGESGGMRTYRIEAYGARDFALHADKKTRSRTGTAGGVALSTGAVTADNAAALYELAEKILAYETGAFGEFPYDSLSIAQGALWTPTASHAGLILVDTGTLTGNRAVLEYELAKAIARQWFGCSVGCAADGQWLGDALSENAALMYAADQYGGERAQALYDARIAPRAQDAKEVLKSSLTARTEEEAHTYASAGTAMLQSLGQQATPRQFGEALKAYAKAYAGGTGSIGALAKRFTEVNADLTVFFSSWIDFTM